MIEYKIKVSDDKTKALIDKLLYDDNEPNSLLYLLLNDEEISSKDAVINSQLSIV